MSLSFFRPRNISEKGVENQNTHFMFDNFFYVNRVIYDIM